VKRILRKNPSLNVNWESGCQGAALNLACEKGHDAIVPTLLAHPTIDINLKSKPFGTTPFMIACKNGSTSCVRLLLQDLRISVNEPDNDERTPLRQAAYYGHLDIIKWWIASKREMDLGTPGDRKTDAIQMAKGRGKTEVVTLLERFKKDACKTRVRVKLELGINGKSPYSPFIFHSDH